MRQDRTLLEEAEGEKRERREMAASRVSTISISIMLMVSRVSALLEEDCLQVTKHKTHSTTLTQNITQTKLYKKRLFTKSKKKICRTPFISGRRCNKLGANDWEARGEKGLC